MQDQIPKNPQNPKKLPEKSSKILISISFQRTITFLSTRTVGNHNKMSMFVYRNDGFLE